VQSSPALVILSAVSNYIMKKNNLIALFLSLGLILSCNKPDNFIIETDIEKIALNASKNGLTVEQNGRLSLLINDSVKKNTIGKSLPIVFVTNLSHQKVNLLDVLDKVNNDFILISSDIYCGFGGDCMRNIFPKSLKKYRANYEDIQVFCLLKRTESDISDSISFNKTIQELKPLYNSIYIIEEKDANRLNMNANPTRLYVTKHMVVKNIKVGINLTGDLYDEIVQNVK